MNNNKKSEIFIPGKLNPIPDGAVNFNCLLIQIIEKPQSATAKHPPPTSLHVLPLSNALVPVKPPKKVIVPIVPVVMTAKGKTQPKVVNTDETDELGGDGENDVIITDDTTLTPIVALSSSKFIKMFKCPIATLIPGSLYSLIGVTTSGWPNSKTGIMQYSFETARIVPLETSLSDIIHTIPFNERKFIPERGK